jgi:hypothetical protein
MFLHCLPPLTKSGCAILRIKLSQDKFNIRLRDWDTVLFRTVESRILPKLNKNILSLTRIYDTICTKTFQESDTMVLGLLGRTAKSRIF